MKKPWEEAWSISDDQRGTVVIYGDDGLYEPILFAEGNEVRSHGPERHAGYDRDHARAQLAAAAPEMARLLLDIEGLADDWCTLCSAHLRYAGRDVKDGESIEYRGHEKTCRLVAVLVKAGVLKGSDT